MNINKKNLDLELRSNTENSINIVENPEVFNNTDMLKPETDFAVNSSQDGNLPSQGLKPAEPVAEQAADIKRQITDPDTWPSFMEFIKATAEALGASRYEVKGNEHEGYLITIYVSDIPVPIFFVIPPLIEAYTLLPGVLIANQISLYISCLAMIGLTAVDIYKSIYYQDKPESEAQVKTDDEKISDKKLEKTPEEKLPEQIDEQSVSKTSEGESAGVVSYLFEYISSFF